MAFPLVMRIFGNLHLAVLSLESLKMVLNRKSVLGEYHNALLRGVLNSPLPIHALPSHSFSHSLTPTPKSPATSTDYTPRTVSSSSDSSSSDRHASDTNYLFSNFARHYAQQYSFAIE